MGVPQGSILSVTLFSLKINSLVMSLQRHVQCYLYVDDLCMYYSSSHMPAIERKLQHCINSLQVWCDQNGFKFSSTKTVCVHFCLQRKIHLDPELYLHNEIIPVVDQTKFLDIIFDRKLSFIPHINFVKTNCAQALNLIKQGWQPAFTAGIIRRLKPDKTGPDNTPKSGFYRFLLFFFSFHPLKLSYHFICLLNR